ncbi:MAG: hypothetical protein VKJ02_15585 [Snowella sp.]|nr:hypothetical protein [Snowella sp.]
MQYEIKTKLGKENQVGLRLKCDLPQAQKVYLILRQEGLTVSKLWPATHSEYSYFLYVNTSKLNLEQILTKKNTLLNPQITLNFKSWQKQFSQAVKQLNEKVPRSTCATQEMNSSYLSEEIKAGKTTDIEHTLFKRINNNDSSALRTLIALYDQTQQYEQIVEITKLKRSEVLALPVSGRLVEQLVSAHLNYYQQTNTLQILQEAQKLATSFLPELERLHQANNVRKLLNQNLNSQESPPQSTGKSLNEQLAELLEIEPDERIAKLKSLNNDYPKATNILLALAETYTAINNIPEALKIYQSIPNKTDKIQEIYTSLLLANKQYQEVLNLLTESMDELSPTLSGNLGSALYYTGNQATALEYLSTAWQQGENKPQILFPLARLWAENDGIQQSGQIYQILQEIAEEQLTLEDYANIAKIANQWGFGDLSDRQIVAYYERCLNFEPTELLNFAPLQEILKERLALWKSIAETDKLLNASADWLDWLAQSEKVEQLQQELLALKTLIQGKKISRQQQFELIESLESYVNKFPQLRDSLANDYLALALAEIDDSIRSAKLEDSFFEDLKRALFSLNQDLLQEVLNYRLEQRQNAQTLTIELVPDQKITEETLSLSSISLALVGGHSTTRRAVIQELKENYALQSAIEVPPSSEAYINQNTVQEKIQNSDLIAVITGYIGHDLTNIISDLKRNHALKGEVLFLNCRGKSGIIRSIVECFKNQ